MTDSPAPLDDLGKAAAEQRSRLARTMPQRRTINIAAGVASAGTLIDAICTYIVIHVLGTAVEGNSWLAHLGAAVGWGPAMLIRGGLGIAGIAVLYGLTCMGRPDRPKLQRGARLAARGMILCALVFGLLALYQAGGLVYSFGITA